VLASIAEQGKLTPELQAQIERASTLTELEDLYAPYKPKRRTRASIARELGLQPLADLILSQPRGGPRRTQQRPAICVTRPADSRGRAGRRADIVAETISDHAEVRRAVRERRASSPRSRQRASRAAADERGVYHALLRLQPAVDRLRPHQVLALNRGEAQKVLRVSVEIPERDWRSAANTHFPCRSAFALGAPSDRRRRKTAPNGCCCRPSSATCAAS
jgi:uncharacterized protein